MAPYKFRGALNIGFQLSITVGILVANVLNYFFAKIHGGWGWRLSLGGAMVPALIITVGSLVLPDTPNSMIERGQHDEAREKLRRIRGVEDVDEEFRDLVAASEASMKIEHPWRNLLQRKYRPHMTMAVMIPFFQQLTGINVIMFYAPVLFNTIGFGSNASLMWFSDADMPGSCSSLYRGQVSESTGTLVNCPSAAQSINVSVNMLFTFIVAQIFLTMLCHLKFGLFLFFAFFVVLMSIFVYYFLPETKGIPIEEMGQVWKTHWFWVKDMLPMKIIPLEEATR
ncbi:hypothetical protein OIU85_027334 [Salix viminalis]|uniref:Major facilitator superfamily (MFS) profile domain-containing protein n=1 Tax=Salix viminalis TaxID=40686 RepID=A0A9Q0QII8_SALVM|nr:hypothetical protein OIU85_027334 [Salix viminalis]